MTMVKMKKNVIVFIVCVIATLLVGCQKSDSSEIREDKQGVKNVSVSCWDGSAYVWLNKSQDAVLTKTGGEESILFHLESMQLGGPLVLLASERWVILAPTRSGNFFNSIYVFDRQENHLTRASLQLDAYDAVFLCGDNLIKVGGATDSFSILSLDTMVLSVFDTDLVCTQGTVTGTFLYDKNHNVVFVSVCSRPELPWFYEVNSGTFSVSLSDCSVQKLNAAFYSQLSYDGECLYGVCPSFFGLWHREVIIEQIGSYCPKISERMCVD